MNMKEVCKKFMELLEEHITDSFYDDDGGDYVELYISSPSDNGMNVEIEIDAEYFGFTCRNYDETYDYDENAEQNIIQASETIKGIIGGQLCEVTIFPEGNFLSASEIAEERSVNTDYLNKLLNECCFSDNDGYIEIVRYNTAEIEKHNFKHGKITD